MHNMAKTIVKSQSIGDVKQGNNTKYDSCVSHFCKLVNCHRSFDSSFCSVKSEKIETISIFFFNFIFFSPDSSTQTQPQNKKCKPRSHFEN